MAIGNSSSGTLGGDFTDAAKGAGLGATLGSVVPGIGNVVGGVLGGLGGLAYGVVGGDPNKIPERNAAIGQLEQQAAAGDPGAIQSLEEWATGQQVSGASQNRSDEPNASRTTASQALSALGINQPAQTTNGTPAPAVGGVSGIGSSAAPAAAGAIVGGAGTSPAPSTSGSVLPAVAGAGLGAATGLAGGGVNGLLAGAGLGEAASEYANQQSLYNTALAQEQNQYNQTAGLRSQGTNALENAVGSAPNLSAAYATPSNPFSTPGAAAPQGAGPLAVSPAVTATQPAPIPVVAPAVK